MALRVLFLCSLGFILGLCGRSEQYPILKTSDTALSVYQDQTLWKGKPFSGTLFSLHANLDTASVASYRDGVPHGIWKKYYTGGRMQEVRFFENGKKTGRYDAWWENGKPKLSYVFAEDEYEGTCLEWNAQGKVIKEMNYHRGHEIGTQRMFYDDGRVRANYVIRNGRRYGLLGTKNCVNTRDSLAGDAGAAAM